MARRPNALNAMRGHHSFGPVEVISVGNQDARAGSEALQDFCAGSGGLGRGGAFAFDVNLLNRDTPRSQVLAAHFSLGVNSLAARSTRGDDTRREFALVEFIGVIETALEYWGGPPIVFSRSENDNRFRWPGFVALSLITHCQRQRDQLPQPRARQNYNEDGQKFLQWNSI